MTYVRTPSGMHILSLKKSNDTTNRRTFEVSEVVKTFEGFSKLSNLCDNFLSVDESIKVPLQSTEFTYLLNRRKLDNDKTDNGRDAIKLLTFIKSFILSVPKSISFDAGG